MAQSHLRKPDLSGSAAHERELVRPGFGEAFRFWLKLGFISFGGPTGQIAIMQSELVDRKRWIGQSRFLHALNFCMLLPGPEATQLAIYIGWLLHRVRGGIVAGVLFVLPSVAILWLLSFVYAAYGEVPWVAAIFYGLKPAVTAIVAAAVLRIGARALRGWLMWVVAAGAFLSLYFFHVPFPLVIATAILVGMARLRWMPSRRAESSGKNDHFQKDPVSLGKTLRVAATCLFLWFLPVIAIGLWRGWGSTLFREGLFFSKAAVVTFGGAYAVLPYVAQQALSHYGWLKPGQMMDGLGLAETTPGPLIMVVQFVGFIGAWQHPEGLSPLLAGTVGALITTWVTFTPCFLWVLSGAPYIDRLHDMEGVQRVLSAVTAAVVGVVLNLAVWFAGHVFVPAAGHIDWTAVVISVIAFVALIGFDLSVVIVIAASGLLGLALLFFVRDREASSFPYRLNFATMTFGIVFVGLVVFFIGHALMRSITVRLVFGETAHADEDGFGLRFDFERLLVRFHDFAHEAKGSLFSWWREFKDDEGAAASEPPIHRLFRGPGSRRSLISFARLVAGTVSAKIRP